MALNEPKTSCMSASVVSGNSNSHSTTHKYTINCCIDYITIVFPYCEKDKYSFDTSYHEIYEDYKVHLPNLSDIELFELIEKDYPGIQPGIRYVKVKDDKEEDNSGLWTLNKIKTSVIHWCKLKKFIPESSHVHIKGSSGYKYIQMFTNNINFKSDGPEMNYVVESGFEKKYRTCSLEVSGTGCRQLEELGVDLLELLSQLYKVPGAHVTRLDNATDLINDNLITMDWLKYKIFDEVSYISKFKSVYKPKGFYKIRTSDAGTKYHEEHGDSIEFGSRTSTSMLVIYDKLLEREEKLGKAIDVDSWLRFELRCFGDKANTLSKKLVNEISKNEFADFSKSLLYEHLDIKTKEVKDEFFRSTRQHTWLTDPLWADFMDRVSKVKIVSQNGFEADFVKTRNWFEKAAFTTQATLGLMYEEDERTKIDSLDREIEVLLDYKDDQLIAMNQYLKKRYGITKEITYIDIGNRINKLIQERDALLKKYDMGGK